MEAQPAPSPDPTASPAATFDPARLVAFARELFTSTTTEEVVQTAARLTPELLDGASVDIEAIGPKAADAPWPASDTVTLLPLPTRAGPPLALLIRTRAGAPLEPSRLTWASAIADAIALALDGISRLVQERGE